MNERHRIVSSESEELILVGRDYKEIGYLSKACNDVLQRWARAQAMNL